MRKFEDADRNRTAKRSKQAFDPALDAPVVLTVDQIEKVAGGFIGSIIVGDIHTRTGALPPVFPPFVPVFSTK
jgi:hypothetical protein